MNPNFLSEVIIADAMLNQHRGCYPNYNDHTPEGFHEWAHSTVEYVGFYKKTKKMAQGLITCTHCHEKFVVGRGIDTTYNAAEGFGTVAKTTCPHCGRRLTIERAHPSKIYWQKGGCYVCLPSVINGIECYRMFYHWVFEDVSRPRTTDRGHWSECRRLWHGADGERVSTLGCEYGYFEAKIRTEYYGKQLPESKPVKEYMQALIDKTNAINASRLHFPACHVIDFRDAPQLPIIKALMGQLKSRAILQRVIDRTFRIPMIETLVKANQVKAAAFLANVGMERGHYAENGYVEDWREGDRYTHNVAVKNIGYDDIVSAFRIAHRHGFVISDPQMYYEYLNELSRLNMDTHSPKYLCPADLAEAHYQTGRRLDRKDAARILRMERFHAIEAERNAAARARIEEEARKKAIEQQKQREQYPIEKAAFLGIVFESKHCKIHVLQNVEEHEAEAKEMEHCLMRFEYWRKEDSIILSCRSKKDDSRISTVELKFGLGGQPFIAQNRGHKNIIPPYINETNAAIKKAFPKFKQARLLQQQRLMETRAEQQSTKNNQNELAV